MLRESLWRKSVTLCLVMALALTSTLLVGCDDDEDDETTVPPDTVSSTASDGESIAFVDDPVKIGVIIDYSGPGAMAGFLADGVIEFTRWYVNDKQGGILVGDVRRPVEFLTYDTKGQVGEASAVAQKALLEGAVAVTLGGIANVFCYPIADVTDSEQVLFSTFLNEPTAFEEYDWTVCSFYDLEARAQMTGQLVVEQLQGKKIATLCLDTETDRKTMDRIKQAIEDYDPTVEFVFEEYVPLDMKDFSSILTRMRYEEPDVTVGLLSESTSVAVATQILEVGGWGDTQFVGNSEGSTFKGIEDFEGANGWYTPVMYLPDSGTPAQIEFGQMWAEKCATDTSWCKKYSPSGSTPLSNHPVMYNPLLTAIKAVEAAGTTDQAKVAEAAMAGLEFDTPLGYLKIQPNGKSNLTGIFVHWEDGVPVPVQMGE